MKNSQYFPFERNKYYYGKMLSVRDFELEQKYNINKRNVLNRYFFGAGIVNGMSVVSINDDSVSVERGFAIDYSGREVVIDEPEVHKLSSIDGYDRCIRDSEAKYTYLCVEYNEREDDVVQNVSNNISYGGDKNDVQYNRIIEGYHLYFTNKEPNENELTVLGYLEDTKTICREKDISVKMILPRYVISSDEMLLKIVIENTGMGNASVKFDIMLDNATYNNADVVHVSFDEALYDKKGIYELTYQIKSADIKSGEISATVDNNSLKVMYQQNEIDAVCDATEFYTRVVNSNILNNIITEYYDKENSKSEKAINDCELYIAKIYYEKIADGCIINRIINAPFKQYLMNPALTMYAHTLINHVYGESSVTSSNGSAEFRNRKNSDFAIKHGLIRLPVDTADPFTHIVYSKDIAHGLGLGSVAISVGIQNVDSSCIFGDASLFPEDDKKVELAVKANPKTGTFVIAAKIKDDYKLQTVDVEWTAVMDKSGMTNEISNRRILIKPSAMELKVRESYNLEAICEKMIDKSVIWSVKGNGGTITANGMYTAPNAPGVYEIMVQSVAYPEVKASIYALVRKE